jgi:cellulose synthase (UDP-forming)
VVRRSSLEEVGGFVTDSLCEDYFTGIRLSSEGYRTIYLGESLSAGMSAENMTDHIAQRMRWARGTLQGFFIGANPLTIRGISALQRLAHFEGIFHWFTNIVRVAFLLMPLAYLFLKVVPYRTTFEETLYFFIPFYLLQLSTFAWLNSRSRSALLSDIYSVAQCFPLALTVIQTMFSW